MDVALLSPDDWEVLKSARLEALGNAPDAFVASLASERKRTPSDWMIAVAASTWVVARAGDQVVGLACMTAPDPLTPGVRFIESVWVTPERRRRGLVRRMLERLEARALAERAYRLQLWVLATNTLAYDAYIKLDFEPMPDMTQRSGKKASNGEPVLEIPMIKPLL